MFWNRYLLPAIGLALLVSILNWLGNLENYYYTIVWYDWLMHFLGGATIATLILWRLELKPSHLMLAVLIVGIGWEIFELAAQINSFSDLGYAWDTSHDLVMDVCGAGVVSWIAQKTKQ